MNGRQRSSSGSRFGTALNWTLKTIIRLLLTIFLLVALAGLAQYGLAQINSRFDDQLDTSIDAVNQRIDLLFSDVEGLMETDRQHREQLAELSSEQGAREEDLEEMSSTLARQEEVLAGLETQTAELMTSGETISQSLAILEGGLVALQGDLNANGIRIDEIGGQIDGLRAEAAALNSQLGDLTVELTEPDAEVQNLQDVLRLFRLWELIARARLRLTEDNAGLAIVDLESALEALGTTSPEEAPSMADVENRLTLALSSLPDDPEAAGRDLDAAWEILDGLLAEALGLGIEVREAAPVEGAEEETTPSTPIEATPTPTPTATPPPG